MSGNNIIDYAALTVSTSVVTLVTDATPTLPARAKRAFITCEDNQVRWRADGTAPTKDEGHSLAADDSISFTETDYRQLLERIQFIRTDDGDGNIMITYFD